MAYDGSVPKADVYLFCTRVCVFCRLGLYTRFFCLFVSSFVIFYYSRVISFCLVIVLFRVILFCFCFCSVSFFVPVDLLFVACVRSVGIKSYHRQNMSGDMSSKAKRALSRVQGRFVPH